LFLLDNPKLIVHAKIYISFHILSAGKPNIKENDKVKDHSFGNTPQKIRTTHVRKDPSPDFIGCPEKKSPIALSSLERPE
jgi:hypothetical protein